MKIDYTVLRLIRHFMPAGMVHFLLRYSLIIKPGYETRAPQEAIQRYQQTLAEAGRTIENQRILVFGYGGNYALACSLLQAGAEHVTLIDKYAAPDNYRNQRLLPDFEQYLSMENDIVTPRQEYIELWQGDIKDRAKQFAASQDHEGAFDLVLSSSVYEHLDDVDGITKALAALTKPDGCQVHYIDMRDHYFKYPFEMLTYTRETWRNWLNPGSNLNRYRLKDYQQVFERYFAQANYIFLAHDPVNFERTRVRIQPEFITTDPAVDSLTLLMVYAAQPRIQP